MNFNCAVNTTRHVYATPTYVNGTQDYKMLSSKRIVLNNFAPADNDPILYL